MGKGNENRVPILSDSVLKTLHRICIFWTVQIKSDFPRVCGYTLENHDENPSNLWWYCKHCLVQDKFITHVKSLRHVYLKATRHYFFARVRTGHAAHATILLAVTYLLPVRRRGTSLSRGRALAIVRCNPKRCTILTVSSTALRRSANNTYSRKRELLLYFVHYCTTLLSW